MIATVLDAPKKLALQEIGTPECPEGGLLLRMKACSICSTDLKMLNHGQKDLVYPRILGHEISGVIAESRAEASGLQEGERVQISPGIACGSCISCRRGADNQCENIRIIGFNHDGGFAEYVQVPKESVRNGGVNPIPDGLSFEYAALAEPLACCLNGQQLSRVGEGDVVLIFGAGPAGCLHAMLARSRGASAVIMVEPLERRVSLAGMSRPDVMIDPGEEDVRERIMEFTDGWGVDAIMLASRDVAVDEALLSLLAPRGRICLFSGLPEDQAYPNLNFNTVHYRENLITGSYGCTYVQNKEAIELIASGSLDVGRLITKRVSLEAIEEGMEHAEKREGLKAVVTDKSGGDGLGR